MEAILALSAVATCYMKPVGLDHGKLQQNKKTSTKTNSDWRLNQDVGASLTLTFRLKHDQNSSPPSKLKLRLKF